MRLDAFLIAVMLTVGGCAAGVAYETPPASPEMVYVSPGVQVIADYNEPIFYADNFYWRNDGGVWYRSRHHTGGWAVATPPPAVSRIERPRGYAHYRPAGWVAHRPPPRGPAPAGRTGFAPPPPHPGGPVRGGYQPPAAQARPAPRPMGSPGRPFAPHSHHDREFHR